MDTGLPEGHGGVREDADQGHGPPSRAADGQAQSSNLWNREEVEDLRSSQACKFCEAAVANSPESAWGVGSTLIIWVPQVTSHVTMGPAQLHVVVGDVCELQQNAATLATLAVSPHRGPGSVPVNAEPVGPVSVPVAAELIAGHVCELGYAWAGSLLVAVSLRFTHQCCAVSP